MLGFLSAVVFAGCVVIDGDTLRCGTERVRLMAIQAPDKQASAPCRRKDPSYVCNDLLAAASTANLQRLVGSSPSVTVVGYRRGAWGRLDADVRVNGQSLNCLQIRHGHATYWAKYDLRGIIKRECTR